MSSFLNKCNLFNTFFSICTRSHVSQIMKISALINSRMSVRSSKLKQTLLLDLAHLKSRLVAQKLRFFAHVALIRAIMYIYPSKLDKCSCFHGLICLSCTFTALVTYGARGLACGLAGSLAFATSTSFHRPF